MTDIRKYTSPDRRKNGGRTFKNTEEILKERTRAIEKLGEYEMDESVGVKSFIVHAIAATSVVCAMTGTYAANSTLLWTGMAVTISALTLGEKWIRMAEKKAREKFKKDNMHLAQYLPR